MWIWTGVIAVVIGVALGALLLVGLGPEQPVSAAHLRDILAEPDAYVGERVVVGGRVEELLTHRALTLGSGMAQGSLLALVEEQAFVNGYNLTGGAAQPHGSLYQDQDYVQLLGTVERFDRARLANQLDIVLNPDLFDRFEGEPVLLVERLDVNEWGGVLPNGTPMPADGAVPEGNP